METTQTPTSAAVTTPGATPSKGLIASVLEFLTKNKKYVLIAAVLVAAWILWKKYGPKKPAPPAALQNPAPNVHVPPPPAALDPNFTRLAAPAAAS